MLNEDSNKFIQDLMDEVMDMAKSKIEDACKDNEDCVRMMAMFHANFAANLLYKICDEYMILMNLIKELPKGTMQYDPNVS